VPFIGRGETAAPRLGGRGPGRGRARAACQAALVADSLANCTAAKGRDLLLESHETLDRRLLGHPAR